MRSENVGRSVGGEEVANRFLLALPSNLFGQLLPYFKPRKLYRGQLLYHAGQPVNTILFINRGLLSLIKRMHDGNLVELSQRGIEGFSPSEIVFGSRIALFERVVQISGSGFHVDKDIFLRLTQENDTLQTLARASLVATFNQIAQIAACNRLHRLEQRICRWLLIAADSARSDTYFVTHENLAMMLGVHRPAVSTLAKELQATGVIRYSRGLVTIVNRAKLETFSCECYRAIQNNFDRLLTPQWGRGGPRQPHKSASGLSLSRRTRTLGA